MILYKVTNGEEFAGYWLDKDAAQKEATALNDYVERHNNNPKVDKERNFASSDKYFVEPIETEDYHMGSLDKR